jgi:hypothetical protein
MHKRPPPAPLVAECHLALVGVQSEACAQGVVDLAQALLELEEEEAAEKNGVQLSLEVRTRRAVPRAALTDSTVNIRTFMRDATVQSCLC